MRVLIVDDVPAILDTLAALLHLHGHQPVTACDYSDAIESLRTQDIDVCVSDLSFPRHPGAEATACGYEVVADCAAMGIPCALMTGGHVDYWQHPELLLVPVLEKPFTSERLMATLARLQREAGVPA